MDKENAASLLTIGGESGDPNDKAHPVVNTLSNACMQAARMQNLTMKCPAGARDTLGLSYAAFMLGIERCEHRVREKTIWYDRG